MKESKCKTCRFCKKPESFETIEITYNRTSAISTYHPNIFCTSNNMGFLIDEEFDGYPDITECTGWKPKKVKV